ncbi:MAG: hypothetical protein QOK29_4482 [Rhodospirillaceae bacterium]|jgi:hypothetical protein|nr:hypothetical protein [Rhodospirillaceae bacterium]
MANVLETKRVQDWANLVLAICLFISPWVLGYATAPKPSWNAWICGIIIAGSALTAILSFSEWEEWLNLVVGVWIVIAPWALGFTDIASATVAHVVLGLLIAIAAAWELWQVHQIPHARV